MKPISFYKEKAELIIEKLNKIELAEFNYGSLTGDIYQDTISGDNSKYNEDTEEINKIQFDIKLMFSEFDNGSLFLQKIENFTSTNIYSNEPLKNHLLNTTTLFVEFIKEYRI